MARSGTWILLVSLTATPAASQEAGSFSELSRLVEAGDDVRVTPQRRPASCSASSRRWSSSSGS